MYLGSCAMNNLAPHDIYSCWMTIFLVGDSNIERRKSSRRLRARRELEHRYRSPYSLWPLKRKLTKHFIYSLTFITAVGGTRQVFKSKLPTVCCARQTKIGLSFFLKYKLPVLWRRQTKNSLANFSINCRRQLESNVSAKKCSHYRGN